MKPNLKLQWILCVIFIASFQIEVLAQGSIGEAGAVLAGTLLQKSVNKRTRKNNRTVWKYTYTAYMKDGTELKINSTILQDAVSGKHFLYYSDNDSVRKIFPEQTIRLTKENFYRSDKEFREFSDDIPLEGIPVDGYWRFLVIKGKINGYSSFLKSIQVNEVQLNKDKIVPVNSPEVENMLSTNQKAYEAFLKKQYFQAISIFNKSAFN